MQSDLLLTELNGVAGRWPVRDWALLDIREAGESYTGHIPFATMLPRRLIEYRIRQMVPDLTTRIVVYDAGVLADGAPDLRSARAAKTLIALGYSRVDILEGGLASWRDAGGTIATGANVPSKRFGERVLEDDAVPSITPEALVDAIERNDRIAIRDVRTEEEFAHHHVPGALPAPGFDLATTLPELATNNDLVIINCAGRTRSIIATATAMQLGIRNVRSLQNGTMGWRLAGLQVASGSVEHSGVEKPGPVDQELLAKARRLGETAGLAEFSTESLAKRLDSGGGPVVLDLRSLGEYSDGHVAGALPLPGGQSIQRTDEFLPAPGRHVVLYDSGDIRAHLAGYWLKRMGFPRVSVLTGGIDRWREEGRPLETGRHAKPAIPNETRLRETADFVDPVAMADLLRNGQVAAAPVVLDVRTSRDYRNGHVPGAKWAPRGWIEEAAKPWLKDKTPVILVGQDDSQALLTAGQLQALGHAEILMLSGGMKAWRKAGLAEETGLNPHCDRYLPDLVEAPYAGDLSKMRAYLDWEVALLRK